MSTLVIADHNKGELAGSTLSVIAAAKAVGNDIDVLVAGKDISGVADQAAKVAGVNKVLAADNDAYGHDLAENLSLLVAEVGKGYSHLFASAGTVGKDAMPRVAAMLDVAQVSDIIGVQSEDTFVRPIYAGNAIATVQSSDSVKVVTVRTTSFDPVAAEGGSASVESVDAAHDAGTSEFVSEDIQESDRPDLASAGVVISGGRGMQNGDNFKMLESVADVVGAAIGASRAAVDAGFVPNDMQVGQTGKIVAPDLYVAVGISGAIQHLAGMGDSKIIVAINKDEDAPIFQVADYGLVADLFDAVPQLEEELKKVV